MNAQPLSVAARLRAAGCVYAEEEARLLLAGAADRGELSTMVDRRVGGVPLEHVLGSAEFCGLRIAVDGGVFVPRPRTGLLVTRATALARPDAAGAASAPPVVVDLCCGSGAVGAAVAARLPRIALYAADVDPAAVRCARRNLAAAGGRVYRGDLYQPLPGALRGRVDVLVANVPYVPTGEVALLPPEARIHEPGRALDGGADGLDVLRRVAAGARRWLAPAGHLLVETGSAQARTAARIMSRSGLAPRVVRSRAFAATVVTGAAVTPAGGDPGG